MQLARLYRIAVVGIGGVGGFVGGKLAAHYEASDDVDVVFVARGENEKAIRANGLKLVTRQGEQIALPNNVTHQPDGLFDLILLCTKSYDLETAVANVKSCVNENTIVVPLLNGLAAASRIEELLPNATVCRGCIYVVAKLTSPGVVEETRGDHKIYFGIQGKTDERLQQVETILKEAGIDATLTEQIEQAVWEKFIFLSPLATLTSFLDATGGEIASNPNHMATFKQLVLELKAIADANKIPLPADIVQSTLDKVMTLQRDSRTSMNNDFRKGGKTEVNTLTAYVVNLGKELSLPVDTYEELLAALTSIKR
jgi:2-dehydropantoate 2-reductase